MIRRVVDAACLIVALVLAIYVRSSIAAVYRISSESMLPTLLVGDRVMVDKPPYRGAWPWFSGHAPDRGEVAIFRAPPTGRETYVKRVIALPGDLISLRRGRVILNGEMVARWRVADLLVPVTLNSPCRPTANALITSEREPDGRSACRYPRYREMLPGGRSYEVLDLGKTAADEFGPVIVPPGRLFLLGDDRDRSADSRFPARAGGGIGLVPIANLIGRADLILLSSEGGAYWRDPRSWWRSLRADRSGLRL